MSNTTAIKNIKPSLRLVAPLTFYIAAGYAVFNITAGMTLFNFPATKFLIVGAISLKIWALIFIILGCISVFELFINNWRAIRGLMLVGIFVKGAWLMELIARSINGKSFILALIWALLLYLQAATYIYFTPVKNYGK